MSDAGHIKTDKMLSDLEKKIANVYKTASKDMGVKIENQLKSYEKNLEKMQHDFDAGKISKKDFATWKKNQAAIISNMQNLSDTLAEDLVNSDRIAASLINGYTPSVYALNYNFGTYQIESDIKASTSFALYDHTTVESLLLYDPDLLPTVDIDDAKDLLWNKKHINDAVTQGILQGESIPKIAKRLENVAGMGHRAAVRNARTATTSAQNKGRVDSYDRAADLGISLKQEWLATFDSRTRASHRMVDGEVIELHGKFSNGCRYPGDPAAPGHEVYNCRCTLLPVIKGFETSNKWKYDKFDYEGWKNQSFEKWEEDQADPYIISKFGKNSMSKVYYGMKNDFGSKIGNDFYYKVMQPMGQPSKVWKDYINGVLDPADAQKIDDYLLKYYIKADKIDDISEQAKNLEKQIKIAKGSPMSMEDADTYKVNPLYNTEDAITTKNCQTSAFAYECRRQGYDVAALPKMVNGKNDPLKDFVDIGTKQKKLAQDQAAGWINKKTGTSPTALIKHDLGDVTNKNDMIKELEKQVGKKGERYTLSVRWNEGGSHVVNLDRDSNGVIRIIDNQRGMGKNGTLEKNTWTIDEYFKEKNIKNIKTLYRVDDCVPNYDYFNSIVVDAKNVKPHLPLKVSDLSNSEYNKLHKIAKAKGESPSPYYTKWKYGIIDDPDLDDIFDAGKKATTKPISKSAVKTTASVDLDVGAFNKKSASAVWKELNNAKAGGGKFWKDITEIGKKNGVKPAEAWKKYLAGELDVDDVKKIEEHLAKLYSKTGDITENIAKIKKKLPNDFVNAVNQYDDDIAEKIWTHVDDELTVKYNMSSDNIWKKYLKGEINDPDLDDILQKHLTAKTTTEIDMDLLKTKKVSKVWNELKDQGGTAYSQFWKTVGEAGKDYGFEKKQSKVWDLYINGKLKPEESKKIDDFLLKHYFKKADDVIDYSKYGGKDVYDILKNYHTYDDFMISPASEFDKISKAFSYDDDKIKAAIDEIEKSKIANATKTTITKSDDLAKAEAKLKKAEEELKKMPNDIYSGIWKDDVTLADYEAKKSTIKAKKIYYEDEIDKLENDPNYKHWISDEDKENLIMDMKHKLGMLDEFETDGKKYAKLQKAVKDAQDEVIKHSPVDASYTQARKDAAVWAKDKTKDYKRVDKIFDPHAKEVHKTRTNREYAAYKDYTGASGPYNKPLVGFDSPDGSGKAGWGQSYWKGAGKVDIDKRGRGDKIRALTDFVEKSKYDFDFWMQSSQDFSTFEGFGGAGFLGVPYGTLKNMTEAELQQFVGKQNKLPQFISGAINKGGGSYNPGDVRMNIYVPRGSEALYVLDDGTFGKNEHEIILQRGGTYRVTKIYWGQDVINGGKKLMIDLELRLEEGYDKFQQIKK